MFPANFESRQRRQTTVEEKLFSDFDGLARIKGEGGPEDPVVKQINRLWEMSTRRPIYIPCAATPMNGCGEAATEAIIPTYGDNLVVGRALFSCGDPECTQRVQDSLRVPSEVVHLSLKGIEEFHRQFGSKKVTDKLVRLLGQGWGIVGDKQRLNRDALTTFFGQDANATANLASTQK